MNLNGLINMLMRMFARRALRQGIRTVTRSGGGPKGPGQSGPRQTPDQRAAAKRARQAAQITRRLGR